jgi:hypothetical protein
MSQPYQAGPLGSIVTLLLDHSVQAELELVGPQLKNIRDAMQQVKKSFAPKMQDLQRQAEAEKPKARAALMRGLMEEVDSTLGKTMRPDQVNRFRQIRLQQAGITAFTEEAVQRKLQLSDEQKSRIKGIVMRGTGEVAKAQRGAPGSRAEAVTTVQEQVRNAVMDVLSERQVTTWKEMIGEPFVFGAKGAKASSPADPGSGPGRKGPGSQGPSSKGPSEDPFSFGE